MVTKLLKKAVPAPLQSPVRKVVLFLIPPLRWQPGRTWGRRLRRVWRKRLKRGLLSTPLNYVMYFGFRYKCPFCRRYLRKFLPCGRKHSVLQDANVVGAGYRLDCRCPLCRSRDKERLLYLYLVNETTVFREPVRLLHVAPELQLRKEFEKHRNIRYLTADINPEKNVMVNMDITDIQYGQGSFDAVVCCHVLEHVSDDRKAMSELYRILKPGGWAILQVPISLSLDSTLEDPRITTPEGREKAFGQADHLRLYARDYKNRLEQAGFSVEEFKWTMSNENYGGSANRYGLNEDEVIYCASKPETGTSSTVS
jgi:SAM-dependent methyltransferase